MMQNRPNLFIVGAPRCGTTAWVDYLSSHPEIAFSIPKEPHFFNDDMPGFRWAKTTEDYIRYFAHAGGKPVIGDASVMYLFSRTAARNIGAFAPDAKIIICLRDQASFLPSYHYKTVFNRDETITDFAEAWRASLQPDRIIPQACREARHLDYRAVGMFSEQVQRYLDHFPAKNILILRYEEWTRNARDAYQQVLAFLNLPDDARTNFEKVHSAHRQRSEALADFTHRPPRWALSISRALRHLNGGNPLNVARKLKGFNKAEGRIDKMEPDLQAEVSQTFAADNEKLQAMLQESGAVVVKVEKGHG